MSVEATDLESKSVGELQARAMVLDQFAREARAAGDPRWKEPARQHRIVTKALVTKIKQEREARGIPEPAPIVIGLEPARIGLSAIV